MTCNTSHPSTCLWLPTRDLDHLQWDTDCGRLVDRTADTPRNADLYFCPHCGGEIRTESEDMTDKPEKRFTTALDWCVTHEEAMSFIGGWLMGSAVTGLTGDECREMSEAIRAFVSDREDGAPDE